MARILRALVAIVFLAASALLTPAAFADPPVLPPLNPPPPPFLTCRATGNGVICEGARTLVEGPSDTGVVCGSGADAFHIFDAGGSGNQHVIRYYDQNGNLTRRVVHELWDSGQWRNPLTGRFVLTTQHNTITDDLAVPGDFSTATETNTGENIFRPLHSAPIFFSTGMFITAPDGTIEFRAGQQNFLDVFIDGHTEVLEPLCAALR